MKINKSLYPAFLLPAFLILFCFSLYDCNDNNGVVLPDFEKILTGTWKETYMWNNPWLAIGDSENTSIETSTISLKDKKFIITVLPFQRVLGFDTSYTGTYRIFTDTLALKEDNDSLFHYFKYKVTGDSMSVSQLPRLGSDGMYGIFATEYLWGNSYSKRGGIFIKLN